MNSSRENIQFVHVLILSSHAKQSVFTKKLICRLIKCTLPVKWPIDYSCGLFDSLQSALMPCMLHSLSSELRDEVATKVCNDTITCFVCRGEPGHEEPTRRTSICHLLFDRCKGYIYCTYATGHYRTLGGIGNRP